MGNWSKAHRSGNPFVSLQLKATVNLFGACIYHAYINCRFIMKQWAIWMGRTVVYACVICTGVCWLISRCDLSIDGLVSSGKAGGLVCVSYLNWGSFTAAVSHSQININKKLSHCQTLIIKENTLFWHNSTPLKYWVQCKWHHLQKKIKKYTKQCSYSIMNMLPW